MYIRFFGFMVLGWFSLALFSYHPLDPVWGEAYASNLEVKNLAGLLGALSGGSLVFYLGAGIFWLPCLLFLLWGFGAKPWFLVLGGAVAFFAMSGLHALFLGEVGLGFSGFSSPGYVGWVTASFFLYHGSKMQGFFCLVGLLGLVFLPFLLPKKGSKKS